MLNKAKTLIGYKLNSRDGEIGKIREFCFDDHYWTIRYLVVDTGNWLTGRQVLISPYALLAVNEEEKYISINLTKKQIEDCPSIDSGKPVSRQFEEAYYAYFGYPLYWDGPYRWGADPYIIRSFEKEKNLTQRKNVWDPYLRNTLGITGHVIQTSDGEIGYIDDFIIDDETWAINYLVINKQNWWAGKKVLVSTQCLESVSWRESKVSINLHPETIKQSLENTEKSLLTRDYETELHRHNKHKVNAKEEPFVEKYVH
jgi:hypothetical protein